MRGVATLLFCFLVLTFAASGCRSRRVEAPAQVAVNVMDSQAQAAGKVAAEKFARGLEKSLKTNDPAAWKSTMPPPLAEQLTDKHFNELQKRFAAKYGKFQQVSYLGVLNQGIVHYHLWKLQFLYQPEKSAPAIPREGVLWIRVMQEKGKPTALDYFGYMPF